MKSSSPTPQKVFNMDPRCEPEGSCRSRMQDNPSPPGCLRWAQSLHHLLQDSDGVKLFQDYLKSEGRQYSDPLFFWFACEGLKKQQAPEKIHQIAKVIYKTYFLKTVLPFGDEMRRTVAHKIKSSQCLEPPITIFDEAQTLIESYINQTTYPNFLKSEMYLQYLESVQNPSSGSSEFSSNEMSNLHSGHDLLPTLHEDMELTTHFPHSLTYNPAGMSTGYQTPIVGPARLTKDMLLMSQKHRAVDVRPKSETYASMFMYRGGSGAHAAYNSYNPVSRQDSEMQSLSSHSDARTESDNMSLTDSSIDGRSMGRSSRRQATIEKQQARKSATLNRETHMNQIVIPRTQRFEPKKCQPMNRDTFASILINKLEMVKKEQETQELLDRKLKENDIMAPMCGIQSRELANAIREKLQLEDDNDQDILDQHVSRVFSDLTPARSPGFASPRQRSPPRNRHLAGSYMRPRRKEKDGFSTFSSDSGNVHDFAETSERTMIKSKSMPEYPDDRFTRGGTSRRSSSKKTLADLTDSGVSVVSDTPPVSALAKENHVIAWLQGEMSMKPSRNMRSRSLMPVTQPEDVTTVVYTFCDEQFPYRTKIPGTQITLSKFKEYLPKKGNYRYFFKTVCEELDNQVIQEEVSNDGDVLPLWEGKIMAQVKPISTPID